MVSRHSIPRIAKLATRKGPHPTAAFELASVDASKATNGVASLPEGRPADAGYEGRRERHRRETFERLVRVAREIMFDRPFSDITIQDITDAADVGKGTFFNYFASKEHVVPQVQAYNRRSVIRATEHVRAREKSACEAMTEIVRWSLCPDSGQWLTYQSNTMRALALNADGRALVSHELQLSRQACETLMALGHEQGSLRGDLSPADLSMLFQTFAAGLSVLLWIDGTTPTASLVDDVMQKFSTLVEAPRPAAPARAPGTRPGKPARQPARRPTERRRLSTRRR